MNVWAKNEAGWGVYDVGENEKLHDEALPDKVLQKESRT